MHGSVRNEEMQRSVPVFVFTERCARCLVSQVLKSGEDRRAARASRSSRDLAEKEAVAEELRGASE